MTAGTAGEGVSYEPDKIVGFGQRCQDPDKDARRTIRLTSTPNFNDIQYLVGKKNVASFLRKPIHRDTTVSVEAL